MHRYALVVLLIAATLEAPAMAEEPRSPTGEPTDTLAGSPSSRVRDRRFRRRIPRTPEEARDPRVAAALRAAPPRPPMAPRYRGRSLEMRAAEAIRRRPRTLPPFRATTPLGRWRVNPYDELRVRAASECLAAATAMDLPIRPYVPEDPSKRAFRRVPVPVIWRGSVEGVRVTMHRRSALVMSCELATRLPVLARAAARHGITHVSVCSAYRRRPIYSYHTVGMALDIHRVRVAEPLEGDDGPAEEWLGVERDFLATPDRPTCDPELLATGSPLSPRARALLGFACDLSDTGAFHTVLTPNYGAGHRDHFHVDVRPHDPRTFLR